MRVAVLALQGAFVEHERKLRALGAEVFEVRSLADWRQPKDALVLPGGESTVMGKMLVEENLLEPMRSDILNGLPVMGTCAGMILLAGEVEEADGSLSAHPRLATMDIRVKRNAYGRQLGSFTTEAEFSAAGPIPMTFIRAPYILSTSGPAVEVLATVENRIVAARRGRQLACAFHPELTDSEAVYRYFFLSACGK